MKVRSPRIRYDLLRGKWVNNTEQRSRNYAQVRHG